MGVQDIATNLPTTVVETFDSTSQHSTDHDSTPRKWSQTFSRDTLLSKDTWIGDYDYNYLIFPSLPFIKNPYADKPQPFFGLHQKLPILLAMLLGFQHALAMCTNHRVSDASNWLF